MKNAFIFLCCLLCGTTLQAQEIVNLAGVWDFAVGDTVTANDSPLRTKYNDYVTLPGSMLTNGKGDPVTLQTQWTGSLYDSSYYFNPQLEAYRQAGQLKFPFFLTPDRHYVGAAWYHRKIYVPKEWKGEHVTLFLERPHIETTVYVNGQEAGHQMSLSTPHRFDVSPYIKAGEQNEIAIRVYNGIENVGVGQDSHSVTDQTQGNWNGITGRIELQKQWHSLYIKKTTITTDNDLMLLKVSIDLENHVNRPRLLPDYDYFVSAEIFTTNEDKPRRLRANAKIADESHIEFSFFTSYSSLSGEETDTQFDLLPWDEFHPNLYHLVVRAGDDVYETDFGLRRITIEGRQFHINGRPLFLRGTVENCCFPKTGYPPTDVDEWMRIFQTCKKWGLNHVRFHSYCPPDAAFTAADRVGIYLQPEGPSWPNHGVKLRRGQVIDQYLMDESKRIVDEYGHHPSFVMMAAGNEPAGDWVAYCNDWVAAMHQYDSTRVYCGASVGGGWAWDDGSEYHVKGGARGLDWDRHAPHSDDDYYDQILRPRNFKAKAAPLSPPEGGTIVSASKTIEAPSGAVGGANNSPIIAHEQGQWCAFPDLTETSQYTGAYKARNFELFSDLLARGGMAPQADKFLKASGHLQALCYKYEMERNLRTPDYAGFQLLSLNDYSGQGTALVGPLNVFWREKGYVTARKWREACNSLVVLARFPRFVYTTTDTLRVPVEAMNALYCDLDSCPATFQLFQNDTLLAADTLSVRTIPIGKNNRLGTIVMPLATVKHASKMTLSVALGNAVQNRWDFWVYPDSVDMGLPGKPLPYICDSLDKKALKVLHDGGDVLLTAAGKVTLGSDVKQTYLPVFWNTSWFKMRPPHTTGACIDTAHPLFRHDFPSDTWSNLNWWELLNRAQVMNLMELPADYQPPIQPIDTWHVSRKLAMLIEARVLKGRLLMTTMDISTRLDQRPVARQMRHAILSYMQSDDFQPTITLTTETIAHFFTRQAPPVDMFTHDSPDELKPKLK